MLPRSQDDIDQLYQRLALRCGLIDFEAQYIYRTHEIGLPGSGHWRPSGYAALPTDTAEN